MSLRTLYHLSLERCETEFVATFDLTFFGHGAALEMDAALSPEDAATLIGSVRDFDRVHVGRYSMDGMSYGCNENECVGTCDGACRFAIDEDDKLAPDKGNACLRCGDETWHPDYCDHCFRIIEAEEDAADDLALDDDDMEF
jgi:hypothetical protein